MASPDELWLVDFGDPLPGEPAYHRPALVVGPPDVFGPDFPFVLVVPLTTARRGLSLHVEIEPTPGNGLVETSYGQCELLRSISARRLGAPIGTAEVTTVAAIDVVIRGLLGH